MYKNRTKRGEKEGIIKVLLRCSPGYFSAKDIAEELKFINSSAIGRLMVVWLEEPTSFLKGYLLESRTQEKNNHLREYRLMPVNPLDCKKPENCLEEKL